jgi:prolyl-tRNA editing enzyme YbaK/EbsC (Cys-tRNA(Pro) deacylase)
MSAMKANSVLVIASMAIALTLGAAERATAKTAEAGFGIALSGAKKKSTAVQNRVPNQIACTVGGCHPIPPGCRPETGYNWDGIPTGFDIVVCPPPRGRRG